MYQQEKQKQQHYETCFNLIWQKNIEKSVFIILIR